MAKARVISVLNQKGGVGKTTMVFNLAHALAHSGHSVLCIDMDSQANLSLLFNQNQMQKEFNIYHLLVNTQRELKLFHQPVMIGDVIITSSGGVDLIPGGSALSGFELTVATLNSPRQLILRRFLEKSGLLEQYDFILIDGPPTLGLIVINMICASQGLLIPFQADQFSHQGLEHLHQTLDDVAEMDICPVPQVLGLIPNLVDMRRKQEERDFSLISRDVQDVFFQQNHEKTTAKIYPPFSNRVQLVKANSQHQSVFAYKSKEFEELQKQFLYLATDIKERLT